MEKPCLKTFLEEKDIKKKKKNTISRKIWPLFELDEEINVELQNEFLRKKGLDYYIEEDSTKYSFKPNPLISSVKNEINHLGTNLLMNKKVKNNNWMKQCPVKIENKLDKPIFHYEPGTIVLDEIKDKTYHEKGLGMLPSKGKVHDVVQYRSLLNMGQTIPKEFDWRTKTTLDGRPILKPVRDQSTCGSCYAFCAATMLQARLNIATQGNVNVSLSPQDLVNCGNGFIKEVMENPSQKEFVSNLQKKGVLAEAEWYALEGCYGGLLASSVDYLVVHGLPTEEEVPYKNMKMKCNGWDGKRYRAKSAHDLTYGNENGFPMEPRSLPSNILQQNIQNMQLAIMNDGPIIGGMNIYSDLYYYPNMGKVYQKKDYIPLKTGPAPVVIEGSHAITIIGWGESKDPQGNILPYWICQNSWGTKWGLDGYFYVERGVNMINIEIEAMAVLVDPLEYNAFPLHPEIQTITNNINKNNISNSSDIEWWGWLLIAIAIALVLIMIITLSVYYSKKNAIKQLEKEENNKEEEKEILEQEILS